MGEGRFITFEGGEGAGKSTQAGLLRDRLAAGGYSSILTREPGGAPGAEQLRELLVRGETGRWSPVSELLLINAARDDHLRNTVRPALDRGEWVICDRFIDSTRAYQGYVGGVSQDFIRTLERAVAGPTMPDLTIVFDLDPAAGLARASGRGEGDDRFERKGKAFHEALRQAFLEISAAEPGRCVVVDAGREADVIAAEVGDIVAGRLVSR